MRKNINFRYIILKGIRDIFKLAHTIKYSSSYQSNMASCYGGERNPNNTGKLNVEENCHSLPILEIIEYKGKMVSIIINNFDSDDCYQQGYELMNQVIEEGKTWPFLNPFTHIDDYCGENIYY